MKPTEVKKYLNKTVYYKGHPHIFQEAIFWKQRDEFKYSAVLKELHIKSTVRCRLEEVEVEQG